MSRPLYVKAIVCQGHCMSRSLYVKAIGCQGHGMSRPLYVSAVALYTISQNAQQFVRIDILNTNIIEM